jgi:hypothetical protein
MSEQRRVFLVVDEQVGIFHAGFDLDRARQTAESIGAVVAAVPILEDYREQDDK